MAGSKTRLYAATGLAIAWSAVGAGLSYRAFDQKVVHTDPAARVELERKFRHVCSGQEPQPRIETCAAENADKALATGRLVNRTLGTGFGLAAACFLVMGGLSARGIFKAPAP
jgi:hypothetical protein